ncbi:MAG: hypothetical protein BCS36_06995 [Desulfovibrio sp. MES5]|nr:MAG: hypothetical protein BCS36_06995 [Desulfovibrio sp. MES5]
MQTVIATDRHDNAACCVVRSLLCTTIQFVLLSLAGAYAGTTASHRQKRFNSATGGMADNGTSRLRIRESTARPGDSSQIRVTLKCFTSQFAILPKNAGIGRIHAMLRRAAHPVQH